MKNSDKISTICRYTHMNDNTASIKGKREIPQNAKPIQKSDQKPFTEEVPLQYKTAITNEENEAQVEFLNLKAVTREENRKRRRRNDDFNDENVVGQAVWPFGKVVGFS